MCLIVDANVAALVFTPAPSADFEPVWDALLSKQAVAVHGGRLTREYTRIGSILRILVELERRGSLRKIADEDVDRATDDYAAMELASDDPHILALARTAKVRLLCLHDQDLHADFTNPRLLRPAGNVYQNTSHRRLIRKHCGKVRSRRKRSRSRGR